ncbi:MAG: hypothetical protein Q8O42_12590 [Acidobacteriota bacterium]|nr:hypothetical protein [Acidobacteriota bacterium]
MTHAKRPSLTSDTKTIAVRVHGRYLIDARPDAVATLVGFHGYQENAAIHLEVLRRIAQGLPTVAAGAKVGPLNLISIQALNRFYTRANAVVAGWMTSEDRELAIADNIGYVAAVLAEVAGASGITRPMIYAGFSQGVAMAYRAAAFVQRPCDGVIALAGDVPPDVAPVATGLPRILLGRGRADKWYTEAKAAADLATLRGAGVTVAEHAFEGGHEWDESFVVRAAAFVDQAIAASGAPADDR